MPPPSTFKSDLTGRGLPAGLAALVALVAYKASGPIREVLEGDETSKMSKESRVLKILVQTLCQVAAVRSIKTVQRPRTLLKRNSGSFNLTILQENFEIVRKSNLPIATLLGVEDSAGKRVGSFYLLNGPVLCLVITDGVHLLHYVHDGKTFIAREASMLDLQRDTDKKSAAALGGAHTDWPEPFFRYYGKNQKGIPGTDGKHLKVRYSGLANAPATGANVYEILMKNGFMAESMSAREVHMWAPFFQAAGGLAYAMTCRGVREIGEVSADIPVVQLYAGNPQIVQRLVDDELMRDERLIDPIAFERKDPVNPRHLKEAAQGISLRTFLGSSLLLGSGEQAGQKRSALIGAMGVLAPVALKVKRSIAMGIASTGFVDSGGADQITADLESDKLFSDALRPYVWGYYSEERISAAGRAHFYEDGAGVHWAFFGDPLDGSSKADTGSIGSIGAFLAIPKGQPLEGRIGKKILAAYFISYGVQTRLFFAAKGLGLHEFILKQDGIFYRVGKKELPYCEGERPRRFALGGVREDWPAGFPELELQWLTGGATPGYSGAMVPDVVGVLQWIRDGGQAVFAYLANKLRVRYELLPMAFILKEAGGTSLTHGWSEEKSKLGNRLATDVRDVLSIVVEPEPEKNHQTAPFAIGDKGTIEKMIVALGRAVPAAVSEAMEKAKAGGEALGGVFSADLHGMQGVIVNRAIRSRFDEVENRAIALEFGYRNQKGDPVIRGTVLDAKAPKILKKGSKEFSQLDPEGRLARIDYQLYVYAEDFEGVLSLLSQIHGQESMPTVLSHPSLRYPRQGHLMDAGRKWLGKQPHPVRMAWARYMYLRAEKNQTVSEDEIAQEMGGEYVVLRRSVNQGFGGPLVKLALYDEPVKPTFKWAGDDAPMALEGGILDRAVRSVYNGTVLQAYEFVPDTKKVLRDFFSYVIGPKDSLTHKLDPEGLIHGVGFGQFVLPDLYQRAAAIVYSESTLAMSVPKVFAHFSAKDWPKFPRREYLSTEMLAHFLDLPEDLCILHARFAYVKMLNPTWSDQAVLKRLHYKKKDMAALRKALVQEPSQRAKHEASDWIRRRD